MLHLSNFPPRQVQYELAKRINSLTEENQRLLMNLPEPTPKQIADKVLENQQQLKHLIQQLNDL